MTDFYVIGVDADRRYAISGPLRTPTWHQYWGVMWAVRGAWVGIRQVCPSQRRWWFVSSCIERGLPSLEDCRAVNADHLNRFPASLLPERTPDRVKDWISHWVQTSPIDRMGVDDIPMTLHKIEDSATRQTAITSYLSNQL